MKSAVTCLASLLIALLSAQGVARADLPSSSRVKTIRSLAWLYENIYSKYLNLDEDSAGITLHDCSDQNNSGTFWRIRRTSTYRGYAKVYVFENRMNGRGNSAFLGIDANTGALQMNWTHDRETTNWLIRYTGKHYGFDAFVIQTLAHNPGGNDFYFLSVDPTTGVPKLTKKLNETSFWFFGEVDDLPTELLGDQGLSAWAEDAGVGF